MTEFSEQLNKIRIPRAEAKLILYKKIRDLVNLSYSYQEVAVMLKVSKTTIYFAIKGRKEQKKIGEKKLNNKQSTITKI